MNYYHLRYNVYEKFGFAVEKERWMESQTPLNDFQVREQLEKEYKNTVSIILSKSICREEFELSNNRIQ